MSLEGLAVRVNTSNQQISRLEKGQRKLDIGWMRRLAVALEIAPWQLLNPEDCVTQTIPLIPWGEVTTETSGVDFARDETLLKLGLESGGLVSIQIEDKSMEPLAPEGSVIVVDLDNKGLHPESYYLINVGGSTLFRKFYDAPPRLEAENADPKWGTTKVSVEAANVIGKVVRVVRNL